MTFLKRGLHFTFRSIPFFILWLSMAMPAHAIKEVADFTEPLTAVGYQTSAIDTRAGMIYITSYDQTSHNPFIRTITTSNFQNFNVLQVPGLNGGVFAAFTTATIDSTGGFAYFGTSGFPAQVVKVRLSNQTVVSSVTFQAGEYFNSTAVLDTANGFGYFAVEPFSGGAVVKVNLATMAELATLPIGVDYSSSSAVDSSGFAYFGGTAISSFGLPLSSGTVVKVRLSDFTLIASLPFPTGVHGANSVVSHPSTNSLYFGTNDTPGQIVQIDLASFSVTRTLALPAGQNYLDTAVTDGIYGYFGTYTSPAQVAQVNLNALTETSSATVSTSDLLTSIIDPTTGYAYFAGDFAFPAVLSKVDIFYGPATFLNQPAPESAHVGDTATFSVTVRGRVGAYQWKKNGLDILSATGSSYSTPSVTFADDGSTYSCLVTSTDGSQILSNSAALTVLPVIRVYPDPWRADRNTGPITFDGLAPGSRVKIFTLSGHWVKDITPVNGAARWDRTNDAGQSVASGYYFYIASNPNSDQTTSGKLAIIK